MSAKIVIQSGGGGGTVGISPRTHYGSIVLEGNRQLPPVYEGPYEAEAKLEEDQTFQTNGRKMTADMVYKGMPVRIVHNPAGGLTYYVGE